MAKILIVDDEEMIRNVIKEYAVFNNYQTAEAEDGMQAVDMCSKNDYDLIIMDIMMPKLDGFTAVKQIKKDKDIPVIMLSARGEEYDKLFGFELGIDDYVEKPFSPKELMARCAAVLSRTAAKNDESKVYVSDGIRLDEASRTLTIDGEKVDITLKEFEILSYLMRNRNIAIGRDRMLSEIWGYSFYGFDRTIDTHIKNIRSRLGKYREKVKTVRGVGYKFED